MNAREDRSGWRPGLVLSEAVANVQASLRRHAVLVVTLAIILLAAGYAEALTAQANLDLVREVNRTGGNTFIVREQETEGAEIYGGISVDRCRAMSRGPGVVSGGTLDELGSHPSGLLDDTPPVYLRADPQLASALSGDTTVPGVALFSRQAADRLGRQNGSGLLLRRLAGVRSSWRVEVEEGLGRLFPSHQTAVVLIDEGGGAVTDRCVLEATWSAARATSAIAAAYLPLRGQVVSVDRSDVGGIYEVDPAAAYSARTSRLSSWIAAGLAVLVLGGWIAGQRSRLALYRSYGFGRLHVAVEIATELGLIVGTSASVALLSLGCWSFSMGGDVLALAAGLKQIAMAWFVVGLAAPVLALPLTIGNPLDAMRER